MRLLIIRHGQTIDNINGICQGQSDGKLSDEGILQARNLSQLLSHQQVDIVISSDLARAYNTAKTAFTSHPHIDIIRDRRLRERYFGDLEGSKLSNFNFYTIQKEGVEPISSMFERVQQLIDELISQYSDKVVALVTHGITIKVIKRVCESINTTTPLNYSIEDVKGVGNCSITEIEITTKLI